MNTIGVYDIINRIVRYHHTSARLTPAASSMQYHHHAEFNCHIISRYALRHRLYQVVLRHRARYGYEHHIETSLTHNNVARCSALSPEYE